MLLISFFLVIILFILSTKEPETQSINRVTSHSILKGRKLVLSLNSCPLLHPNGSRRTSKTFVGGMTRMDLDERIGMKQDHNLMVGHLKPVTRTALFKALRQWKQTGDDNQLIEDLRTLGISVRDTVTEVIG
jgi:hypothetical protein